MSFRSFMRASGLDMIPLWLDTEDRTLYADKTRMYQIRMSPEKPLPRRLLFRDIPPGLVVEVKYRGDSVYAKGATV